MAGFGVRAAALLLAAAGALALSGCRSSDDRSAGNGLPGGDRTAAGVAPGRLGVVAAENFWGDIAAQVGGAKVAVTSIVSDPNADPHQYETSARDAAAIDHAAFVIENGLGYDDFVGKLLRADPKSSREVLTIAEVVQPPGDNPNPHLWYDPDYVIQGARAIAVQLTRESPADAAMFASNLKDFLAGEQQVAGVIAQIRAKYSGTPIAYTERVPGYLIEAAGLMLGTPTSFSQSIENGDDPSPGDNAAFQLALKDHKVRVLLYNAQVTSPATQALRKLARSNGIAVVGVTETMPADAKNFQTWQAEQARALLAALGG